MIFLTFLSFCVKLRKCKIIRVKRLSVANRWHCHPEGSTIAFHRVHKHGYHSHKACSNDNIIFLLDYLYYSVCEVGCRWFFDHYLLIFTDITLHFKNKNYFSVLHQLAAYHSSGKPEFFLPFYKSQCIYG